MSKPIRILQVFGALNRGGSETAVMTLYRNIDKNKVQFDFVIHTDKKCDYEEEIIGMGGKIYRFSRLKISNYLKYQKEWEDFLESHPEYRVIHGHYFSISSVYFKIAKKYKLICIAHAHTSRVKGLKSIPMKLITYPLRYLADYLFACSYEAGVWLYGKKATDRNTFKIIRNSIDTEKFIYSLEDYNNGKKKLDLLNNFVIGHIGRFNKAKNHSYIIDVFEEVNKIYSNAVLLLVGDGPLKAQIEKKVTNLGLQDKVFFLGVRSDIPDLLKAMDVFIFPSIYEGLPVTLIEAQASGLKCIVSDRITKEVKVTNLIEYKSIDLEAKYWAQDLLKHSIKYQRENMYYELSESGYDIKQNGAMLEKIYMDLHILNNSYL